MHKYFLHLIFFSLYSLGTGAQSFLYEGSITGIKVNSLYKIPLTPDVKKYMRKNLSDLRIFDSAKKEVPFIVFSEPLLKQKQDFIAYEIVSQNNFKNYMEIVVKNANKDKISNIAFNINNSDASKYCAIEGSDDGKQWYSVSALQELSLAYNNDYTNSFKCMYFPLNNYLFFRLKIENLWAEALKINSAGYFKNSVIAGKLNEVSFKKSITEDPEKKITNIRLSFNNNQQIDRIDFKIKSPRLFVRHARIYTNRTETHKNKTTTFRDVLFECDLSSDKSLFFDLPGLNEKELFIEIENNDNPPLTIENIGFLQLESYLVCDLDAGNKYTLKCGDARIKAPKYDLVNFVSSVPQLLPVANIERLKEVPGAKIVETEKPKSFFEKKGFLWLCIGLGTLVVLIFSLSLLKDMKEKNS